MNKIELNKGQAEAVRLGKEFLKDPTKKIFTLKGAAGTGKSFVSNFILDGFQGFVVGIVYSHSARNVLASAMPNKMVRTIASGIGLTMDYDDKGKEKFVRNENTKKPLLSRVDLVVIDEVSMLGQDMLDNILQVIPSHAKIIALGDLCQLSSPDGSGKISPFFNYEGYELTEVMRYKNPAIKLGDEFRNEIGITLKTGYGDVGMLTKRTGRVGKLDASGEGYSFAESEEAAIEEICQRFKETSDKEYGCRILAYRNATVDAVNANIRTILYGEDAELPFVPNELIIANNNLGNGVIFNGMSSRVISYEEYFHDIYKLPCLKLKLSNAEFLEDALGERKPILVIDPQKGVDRYEQILEDFEAKIKRGESTWREKGEFKNQFLNYSFGYCSTIYKSQGLTLDYCLTLESDVMSIPKLSTLQKMQAMYVAITRAKKVSLIYKE